MELKDLQSKKRQLEIDLYHHIDSLLKSFSEDSGVEISDIDVYLYTTLQDSGMIRTHVAQVSVHVEL